MSLLLSNLTFPSTTAIGQKLSGIFSPRLQDAHALPTPAFSLKRRDDGCTQTVEVPVWYGSDYNTCSMQAMTAPCSVSFPVVSCHTHVPPRQPLPTRGLSEMTKLWIIVGFSIFSVIFITFVVLWAKWKLNSRRRGGKRSISVQLEKNEAIKSKSKPASESTSTLSSGSGRQPKIQSGRRTVIDLLLGRNQTGEIHTAGKYSYLQIENTSKLLCRRWYSDHEQH